MVSLPNHAVRCRPMRMTTQRLLSAGSWLLLGIVAFGFVIAVAKPIILTASDLGRHLTNGMLFLDHGHVATTNLYSYTHPDFPFLNHHWGSGVFFELARRFRGFVGVSVFGLCVVFLTAVLYLRIAWAHGKFWLALSAAFLLLPVFASRSEIRPELFSYLFSAIFLWILLGVRNKTIPSFALAALPILLVAWVNLHIYFFLGIGWTGAFFLDALFRAWRDGGARAAHLKDARNLFLVLLASCAVAPLNPNGWKGAVYPLLIFQNYAYAVAENQPVSRIMAQGQYPPGFFYRIALGVLTVTWMWRLYRDWRNRSLPDVALLILTLFVSIIAWKAIRNFTIFAYVGIVSLSAAWSDVDVDALMGRFAKLFRAAVPVAILVLSVALYPMFWVITYRTIGLGVAPGILRSTEFFKEQGLKGPIFNNYDIGGFLTYGLYPQERVFVDNRPEAYPGEFFLRDLLPMQMNDEDWLRVNARYGFNAIFFYRHDATRWGQSFMIRRLADPAWAPVFVDNFVIVIVRRTPENADVIARFEIPKSRFDVQPRRR